MMQLKFFKKDTNRKFHYDNIVKIEYINPNLIRILSDDGFCTNIHTKEYDTMEMQVYSLDDLLYSLDDNM